MLVTIAFWSLMVSTLTLMVSLFIQYVIKDDERETSQSFRGISAIAWMIGSFCATWIVIGLYLDRR